MKKTEITSTLLDTETLLTLLTKLPPDLLELGKEYTADDLKQMRQSGKGKEPATAVLLTIAKLQDETLERADRTLLASLLRQMTKDRLERQANK